ncbi:MAG: AAA family ATPase, partial [Nitrospirae bacterium]|nr:AAA family ATPase [Nitrospirota bacterium]
MKIVKLELNGFKSFAEKVSFSMHPGITCIVGPNGSGKSNVVDALRWVLGEQSPKTLRGEKMEEIIFNGTSLVKQKGMAEVTLTLSRAAPQSDPAPGVDGAMNTAGRATGPANETSGGNGNGGNGNGKGPARADADVSNADDADVSERTIEVSRRLFRSGESEYIINKVKTRLRDVRDLFLDTGLEVKSYSILEQGRIAEILNARPIDRRFLIEEAAGVMKYKVRRSEAISKLEKSRANLERVNDVISEVKRSITALERQVKKAEKYRAAIAALTDLELRVAWRDYESLRKAFDSFTGEFEALAARLSVIKGTDAGIEEALEELNASLGEKMGAYEELSRRTAAHEKDRTALEKHMALLEATIDSITGHLDRLDAQSAEYSQERNDGKTRDEELSCQEEELRGSIASLEGEIEEDRKGAEVVEKENTSIEDDLREKNRRLFQVSEQISNVSNDLSRLQMTLGSLHQKKDSSLSFLRGASESLETRVGEIASLEKAINEKEARLALARERIMVSKRTIGEQEAVIESLRKDVAALREQIASDSSRLKSIEEMSAGQSTALELAASVEVLAPISSVVVVPRQFEVAIENSLAHRLKGFVVKNKAALGEAVRFLKEGGWERTSLVAPDMVREASTRYSQWAPTKKDGITNAASLLQGEGAMIPVLRALLRDFYIVKDFDEAIGHFS